MAIGYRNALSGIAKVYELFRRGAIGHVFVAYAAAPYAVGLGAFEVLPGLRADVLESVFAIPDLCDVAIREIAICHSKVVG